MIQLNFLDFSIISSLFVIILGVGLYLGKSSGKDSSQYFLSGRNMPWWLLGASMVATTFSTDTPNLVADIVRTNGVAGNWVWWAFLLTGLLTVFVYARLWRKSNVKTDIEFYELRYGGKPARFLRSFRAIYLGVIYNVLAMAGVTLSAIKIGQIMLGVEPLTIVIVAGLTTVIFSAIGGFKGVVYTDLILFFVAMTGAIGAAIYIVGLPEIGGLEGLVQHKNVLPKMSLLPDFSNTDLVITLLIIPLSVQWWSSWYPGSEPGGGGYVAQRMLAAKNENHAIGATFFFNVLHYAVRPWPWILVALASLIVFPDLASISEAFPNISADKLGHDLAYPAMLTKLPTGLLGLVLASLAAAYMSTISSHLNWGASYVVNDYYAQQVNPEATEKQLVNVGRITTVVLMTLSASIALVLTNALQFFEIILMFGAGTGLVFILRWFWWRLNAWTEISAMLASGVISILINFTALGEWLFAADTGILPSYLKFPFVVFSSMTIWLIVTFMTKAEKHEILLSFYKRTQPGGPGWTKILADATADELDSMKKEEPWNVPSGIIAMLFGCALIYALLFGTGFLLYGLFLKATLAFGIALLATWRLLKQNIRVL